jgi:hypothetical protein
MILEITLGWWLIPAFNSIAGFCWAWQPAFKDQQHGGSFYFPPTSFFATIPAIMWALFNWLIYFIVF